MVTLAFLMLSVLVVSLGRASHSTDRHPIGGMYASIVGDDGVPLVLLPNTTDGVCLDGSPGGYYLKLAPEGSIHNDEWIVYMQGGGLCTNEENCNARAQTDLGSSTQWKGVEPWTSFKGPVSRNCTINPTFCEFNVVLILYCDGFFYTGNLESPLYGGAQEGGGGRKLYSRGAVIRQRVLEQLKATTTIGTSRTVLFSGCSAGGLSTYLHADSMAGWFRSHTTAMKIRSLPLSGFFLNQPTVDYDLIMSSLIKRVLVASNGTAQLNAKCLAANPNRTWVCAQPEVVYSHSEIPTFVLNSQSDAWQINCELFSVPTENNTAISCSKVQPYAQCVSWEGFAGCNITEARPVLAYQDFFLNRVLEIDTFRQPGHGAYISSCFTHCEAVIGEFWSEVEVAGSKMNAAVDRWWAGDGSEASSTNTYIDCTRTAEDPDYSCNPTCDKGWGKNKAGQQEKKVEDQFQVDFAKWEN